MKRVKPCQNCKKRRRKCERKENSNICERCIRLNLICSFDTEHYDPAFNDDKYIHTGETIGTDVLGMEGDSVLTDLYQHIKEMEKEMEILQIELNKQRKEQQIVQTTKKRRMINHHHDNNNNNNNNMLTLPSHWKITIANGQLRLETGINSLGELLNLGYKYNIRSLSPFDNQPPLRFRITGRESFIVKFATLLDIDDSFRPSKNDDDNDNQNSNTNNSSFSLIPHDQSSTSITISWDINNSNSNSPKLISSPTFSTSETSSPLLSTSSYVSSSPSSTSSTSIFGEFHQSSWNDYALVIDILVTNHFNCQNVAMPLLHKPTFMKHYTEIELVNQQLYQDQHYYSGDKSSIIDYLIKSYSPITLSICCFACVSFCRHIPLTAQQKRDYSELFYLACKDRIYDMLDDPDRQLEALICINFIFKFAIITLRIKEGRRLITFAYLITCEFKHLTPSDYSEIELAMMQRHGIVASVAYTMTEYLHRKHMLDDDIDPKVCPLTVLPDETGDTLKLLNLYQHLIELGLHPISRKMIEQLRYIVFGDIGNLNLQDILDYDKVCMEWYKGLPQDLRYTDNPYGLSSISSIERCNEPFPLMAHTFLLTMTVGIYTCLCHPLSLDDQITLAIQHRATALILDCCELLMATADRMKSINNVCGFACEYIFRVLDSLVVLGEQVKNHQNNNVDNDLVLKKIKECITRFDFVVFEGHEVPINDSVFARNDFADLSKDESLAVYKKYPFPGYAIVYDIMNSSANKLGANITNTI
ncbi:unnamed protein product [Cunninghamella blakesleeana]